MNKVPFGRATLGMNIVYITFTQEDSRLGENVALLLLSCFDTRSISRGDSLSLSNSYFSRKWAFCTARPVLKNFNFTGVSYSKLSIIRPSRSRLL